MNAGEVYQRYQTLANKAGNGGYATPERFALDYKQAEMQFFSTNYDNVKQYSKGDATPNGTSMVGQNGGSSPSSGNTNSATTGITISNNSGTGGTAIDMRQSSEGCFYIIKT